MWDNNAWIFFYDNSTDGAPPFLIQDFIHAFQPNAKLIVMLRDPVERLATIIHFKLQKKPTTKSWNPFLATNMIFEV